jgi:hypothetical protein
MIPLAIGLGVLGFAAMQRAFAAGAAFETSSSDDAFVADEAFRVGLAGPPAGRLDHYAECATPVMNR